MNQKSLRWRLPLIAVIMAVCIAYHGQDEAPVTRGGGPKRCMLKNARMSCGKG